jgi:RNA polymerase sigma-70 factor (ECF subfamily)
VLRASGPGVSATATAGYPESPQSPGYRGGTVTDTARGTDDSFLLRLYAEHARFLLVFVQRLTSGDVHWAEDVMQETLLRAWRHADELLSGGQRSLRPWLSTVARRIVINDRHRRRDVPQEVDDTMFDRATIRDDIEQMLTRSVLVEAMERLAPAHRRVIVEVYLRGRTVNAAAAALGIPVGTVKSRTYHALRALRTALRDMGVRPLVGER